MTSYTDTKLLITGAWRPAASGDVLEVLNPADESVYRTRREGRMGRYGRGTFGLTAGI